MTTCRLGKQTPRYKFFLNPYVDARFTRCPLCEAKTRQKKLPLAIHIDEWGMVVLNKTCRFCPGCELLIAHQDQLEANLATFFDNHAPHAMGNDYLVVGTVDRPGWKRNMETPGTANDMIEHLHDFKDVLHFKISGGWMPPE